MDLGLRDGDSDSKSVLAAKALAVEEQNVPGAVDINKQAGEQEKSDVFLGDDETRALPND